MVKKFLGRVAEIVRANRTWVLSWAAISAAILLTVHFWPQPPSPVPQSIRRQANFTIVYPQGYQIQPSSWQYQPTQMVVEFTATRDGIDTAFTEQAVPLAYQNDQAAYDRFIGSLRPLANFDVPLGTVSLTNFVTAGDYQIVGKTGILNTHGTLLLVHPNTDLTDDQWRTLFESLQLDH